MIPTLLLAITTTFSPARPTVGDPISVTFPAPVTVQQSKDYEVISQRANVVVVRTFEPKPFVLHTSASDVVIPVHSVLQTNDKLDPAPLKPPRAEGYPRAPFIAIAIAAAAAIAAWVGVVLLARRRTPKLEIVVDPTEHFRATVLALRGERWADLADATRRYLAATDPRLGMELTTRELLARNDDPSVAEILRQGDLQKFSPWGAAPGDFAALARRALALIPEPAAEEVAA
ncbi:MAG: hypothetical protein AABO58_03355 [Acidobacteriota bacterium]